MRLRRKRSELGAVVRELLRLRDGGFAAPWLDRVLVRLLAERPEAWPPDRIPPWSELDRMLGAFELPELARLQRRLHRALEKKNEIGG